MFLHVTHVAYLKDYQLRLEFNDGKVKDLDLKDELYGEIFEPLRELVFFRKVSVNPDTGCYVPHYLTLGVSVSLNLLAPKAGAVRGAKGDDFSDSGDHR